MKNEYYKWIYYKDEQEYSLLIPIIKSSYQCLAVFYNSVMKEKGVSFNYYPISEVNDNIELDDEMYSFKNPPPKIKRELEREAFAAVFVNAPESN